MNEMKETKVMNKMNEINEIQDMKEINEMTLTAGAVAAMTCVSMAGSSAGVFLSGFIFRSSTGTWRCSRF